MTEVMVEKICESIVWLGWFWFWVRTVTVFYQWDCRRVEAKERTKQCNNYR